MLTCAGVGAGHVAEYFLLAPHHHVRHELLSRTGHHYLPTALSAGAFVALVALSLVFLGAFGRGLGRNDPRRSRVYSSRALPAAQMLAFAALEVGERLVAHASLADIGIVLAAGLPLQALVGFLASRVVATLEHVGERLGVRVSGGAPRPRVARIGTRRPSTCLHPASLLSGTAIPARGPPPSSFAPNSQQEPGLKRAGTRTRSSMRSRLASVAPAVVGTIPAERTDGRWRLRPRTHDGRGPSRAWRHFPGSATGVVLGLSACGDDEEPAAPASTVTTAATPPTSAASGPTTIAPATTTTTVAGQVVSVTVRGGQVQGPSRQRVERNEMVTVRVTSDVADELHVHSYNQTAPVAAGATAEVSFSANIPGIFEVEFERSHKLLFTLEVRS